MLDEKFYERKELIIRNNELNKNFDEKKFKKNINKKIELEQKLESISITSDVLASGNLARKNVLNSAVKPASTYSYVNDVVIEDSSKESKSTTNIIITHKKTKSCIWHVTRRTVCQMQFFYNPKRYPGVTFRTLQSTSSS